MIHVHGYLGELSDDTRALAEAAALVVGGRRHLADLGVGPERQVVLGALTWAVLLLTRRLVKNAGTVL